MPDDRVDPREEAAVRRLLAQARHDEPIPPEVAARLDDALSGLSVDSVDAVEESAGPSQPAGPVVITSFSRTRRRRAGALVLAAAAVVLVGVGISQYDPGMDESTTGANDSAASGSQVDRGADARPEARSEAPSQSGGTAQAPSEDAPKNLTELPRPDAVTLSRLRLAANPPQVSEERFGRDVRDVRRRVVGGNRVAPSAERAPGTAACADVPVGAGQAVAVRYAQAPAVLVLRPPRGQSQVVDLLSCADGAVTRSVTLPAR